MANRIYLDNAATTWPKPESVYTAVVDAMREIGVSVGRGAFEDSLAATRQLKLARAVVAKYVKAADANSIVFTNSGTDSLSTAILGLLKARDRVVTTAAEHNSVLRPLKHLESTIGIDLKIVPCDKTGVVAVDEVVSRIESNTRLLAMTHASNVTGAVQPILESFTSSKKKSSRLVTLLDAAQTLGHLPIDVAELNCDILAAPGHKGLYGPLGTGVLYINPALAKDIYPLRFGGTGSSSNELVQPSTMPEKFEAGNINHPAIAGLKAGLDFIASGQGKEAKQNLQRCSEKLLTRLQSIKQLELFLPQSPDHRVGIFSFSVAGIDPHEVAALLDSMAKIQVRSGLHCAPLLHKSLGTVGIGGTVRLSVSGFNTIDQIETTCDAIEALVAEIGR